MCTCRETQTIQVLCSSCVQRMLPVRGSSRPIEERFKSFFGLTDRQLKKGKSEPRQIGSAMVWA